MKSTFISFAAILIFITSEGKSQTIVSAPGSVLQNQIFISIGLEPELVTTIGYTRLVWNSGEDVDLYVGAGLKMAPLILSNRAWRFNLVGLTDWQMSEKWNTRFTSNLYLAHDNNRAGIMHGLGGEFRATLMHFGKTWAKGIDVGWQYTALTHIKHSRETKDTFRDRYPPGEVGGNDGPINGWYRATASRFRLGLAGSKNYGEHWRLQLGIGALLSIQKQGILLGFSHAQVPFYLESTITYRY